MVPESWTDEHKLVQFAVDVASSVHRLPVCQQHVKADGVPISPVPAADLMSLGFETNPGQGD